MLVENKFLVYIIVFILLFSTPKCNEVQKLNVIKIKALTLQEPHSASYASNTPYQYFIYTIFHKYSTDMLYPWYQY